MTKNMDNDYVKEKIKALTEFLRGLYGLFILIGTGVATLLMRKTFIVYHGEYILIKFNIDFYIMLSGFVIDFIIFVSLLILYKRIHVFIKKLKQL